MKKVIVLLFSFTCMPVFSSGMEVLNPSLVDNKALGASKILEHIQAITETLEASPDISRRPEIADALAGLIKQAESAQSEKLFEKATQKEECDDADQNENPAFSNLEKAYYISIFAKRENRFLTRRENARIAYLVENSKETLFALLAAKDIEKSRQQIDQALIILCKKFFPFVAKEEFALLKSYVSESFNEQEKQTFKNLEKQILENLEEPVFDSFARQALTKKVFSFGEALKEKTELEQFIKKCYLAIDELDEVEE